MPHSCYIAFRAHCREAFQHAEAQSPPIWGTHEDHRGLLRRGILRLPNAFGGKGRLLLPVLNDMCDNGASEPTDVALRDLYRSAIEHVKKILEDTVRRNTKGPKDPKAKDGRLPNPRSHLTPAEMRLPTDAGMLLQFMQSNHESLEYRFPPGDVRWRRTHPTHVVLGLLYTLALHQQHDITKVKGPWSHDIPLAACLQALGIVPGAPDGRYVRYTPPVHAHTGWRSQCGQFMHDTHNWAQSQEEPIPYRAACARDFTLGQDASLTLWWESVIECVDNITDLAWAVPSTRRVYRRVDFDVLFAALCRNGDKHPPDQSADVVVTHCIRKLFVAAFDCLFHAVVKVFDKITVVVVRASSAGQAPPNLKRKSRDENATTLRKSQEFRFWRITTKFASWYPDVDIKDIDELRVHMQQGLRGKGEIGDFRQDMTRWEELRRLAYSIPHAEGGVVGDYISFPTEPCWLPGRPPLEAMIRYKRLWYETGSKARFCKELRETGRTEEDRASDHTSGWRAGWDHVVTYVTERVNRPEVHDILLIQPRRSYKKTGPDAGEWVTARVKLREVRDVLESRPRSIPPQFPTKRVPTIMSSWPPSTWRPVLRFSRVSAPEWVDNFNSSDAFSLPQWRRKCETTSPYLGPGIYQAKGDERCTIRNAKSNGYKREVDYRHAFTDDWTDPNAIPPQLAYRTPTQPQNTDKCEDPSNESSRLLPTHYPNSYRDFPLEPRP
ncbi:hypothetical protein EDC01DRAFT_758419 [Geopyxis carbonaria]|nr:hypothetical protein EDC01DRAFT_758419 [Geopyxis carbonaria]